MKAQIAVIPSSVALDSQLPWVAIVDESLLRIPKRHAIPYNMVRRRIASDPKFEAIPIAVELSKPPSIETISPGVDFFHDDRGAEHEEIQAVVDVVPQSGVSETIALAGTFFAGETVGGLTVLARVAVAVGVEVDDCVVRGGALELEAGFVVVVG